MASWNSHIGVASCLKWAPRRAMFVAASTVLTFWIPDNSKLNADPASASISMDTEAPTQSELTSQWSPPFFIPCLNHKLSVTTAVLVFIFILPAVKKFWSCPCYLMLHLAIYSGNFVFSTISWEEKRANTYALGFVWLVVLAKYGGKMQKRSWDDWLLVLLLELFKLTHPSFLLIQIDPKKKVSLSCVIHRTIFFQL